MWGRDEPTAIVPGLHPNESLVEAPPPYLLSLMLIYIVLDIALIIMKRKKHGGNHGATYQSLSDQSR